MVDQEALQITALNAMAASPDGRMTVSDLIAHLETRLGSSDETSKSAQSAESRNFEKDVRELLSPGPNSGSLVDRNLANLDDTGGQVQITAAGRRFIGRST